MIGFPKPTRKKKRRHHPPSKIHPKDGTCLLCMLLKNDYTQKITEEHHIFFGNPGRRLSEEHGLKVDLCLEHHRIGSEAVHNNRKNDLILKRIAQAQYERTHTREEFRETFGKSYLEE